MEADELIFKAKRPQLILQALIMGAAFGLSVWTMGNAEIVMHYELRLMVFFISFLGCVVFGYLAFYNFLRVFKHEPLLKADAAGLWFHASPIYHGKILWSEIEGYEVAKYGLSRKVLVKLKRPAAYLTRYSDMRKHVFKRMMKRYGTPVSLPFGLFEDDVVGMLKAISAYGARSTKQDLEPGE